MYIIQCIGPQKGPTQVTAHACDRIQAKILLGWIWPKTIYESVEQKKLEKNQVRSFRVGDKVYRGILREKAGPPGCIEYSKISDAGATISGVVANSINEVENEVEHAWAQAAKRTRTVVKEDKQNPGSYKVSAARRPGDSDSDSSGAGCIMDSIWGKRMPMHSGTKRKKKTGSDSASDEKNADGEAVSKRRNSQTN